MPSERVNNIDLEDERFEEVESGRKTDISRIETAYKSAADSADAFYKTQAASYKAHAEEEADIIDSETEAAVDEIKSAKAAAKDAFTDESKAAYADYKGKSAAHGVNAEKTAAMGLTGTGYSESSDVAMYNSYQTRVARARESYSTAVTNFDNAIKDARLAGSAKKAEIAYRALEEQLAVALEGFKYKEELLLTAQDKKTEINDTAHNRWMDVYSQLADERDYSEQTRRYDEERELEEEKLEISRSQWQDEMNRLLTNDASSRIQWQLEMNRALENDRVSHEMWQAEMNRALENDRISEEQWREEMARALEKDRISSEQWREEMNRMHDNDRMALAQWMAEMEEKKRQFNINASLKKE